GLGPDSGIFLTDGDIQSATLKLGTPKVGHNSATVVNTTPNGPAMILQAGNAGDEADVQGNSSPVTVKNFATVNVGNQGNVQGVRGSLYVQSSVAGQGTVDINDSQDPATLPAQVTLDQYQDPVTGLLYESITNLSLAAPIYVED